MHLCGIKYGMVASKGLTKQIRLRMTDDERELLDMVRKVYGDAGVPMSINDTLRHLIRRGGIVLPHTVEESRAAISAHCATCKYCDEDTGPKCPEGVYLARNFKRVRKVHQGTER